MVFTLEALTAKQGDCLLLHFGPPDDPSLILIDAGPAGVYAPVLRPRLAELKGSKRTLPLEMVMVSHIDDDHIHGVLDFVKDLHNQRESGVDPLPYSIRTIWHNSFERLLERLGPSVAAMPRAASAAAGIVPAGFEASSWLGTIAVGVKQGNELRNLATKLAIPLNEYAGGPLVMAEAAGLQRVEQPHGLSFTILGPREAEMEKLREEWKEYEENRGARAADFEADYLNRTASNLSSIVVLAELDTGAGVKTMLLTGDAGGDLIMESLETGGLLSAAEPFKVDLLKVQHHGSMHSVDVDFFRKVQAPRYVISGNGKHHNPHEKTLQWLSEARAGEPYEVYLTYREGAEGLTDVLDRFLERERVSQPRHVYHFPEAGAYSIAVALGD